MSEKTDAVNDLEEREKEIAKREEAIEKKTKELNDHRVKLNAKIRELNQDYEKRYANINKEKEELEEQKKEIDGKAHIIEKREEMLRNSEEELLQKEISIVERETAITQREETEESNIKKRQIEENAKLEESLLKKREEFEESLFKEQEERFASWEEMLSKRSEEIENRLTTREEALHKMEDELNETKEQLSAERRKIEREKRRLGSKEEDLALREEDLSDLVEKRMAEKIADYNSQLLAKDESLSQLRDKITELIREQNLVEAFKVSLGEDPFIIEDKIRNLNRTIDELKEELAGRASGDIQRERDAYKADCDSQKLTIEELQKQNRILQQRNDELSLNEINNNGLISRNQSLASRVEELELEKESLHNEINRLGEELKRLCASEDRSSDREQRIAAIRTGYLKKPVGAGLPMELSEIDWLNTIYAHCDAYGIHFPRRILYAFHTALKISDWSSVTVLAGVSGTGKSELPRLYAAFGGMNFINVPVQPSWDSQESMLGFFNSIDNRFEPEPLLRFLVQCTEDDEYSSYMSIVLLDEMNLAHVEHYFADFLSKLEVRRGSAKSDVPTVEVKLGAGVKPYDLRLERSILWTGTMNQDETTKSLSDKVLDRGLIINFPRPRELKSRVKMNILDKLVVESNRPMLTRSTWGSWIVREVSLEGDQKKELNKYKLIVEEINDEMEHVGRALGHRVWQSIEYYIVNYPLVKAEMNRLALGEMSTALGDAMKTAFEDQIVQKIMPKLRGVETRGRGKENLDRIEALLVDKGFDRLKDDFEIACEQGYGQFIWSSAKYIETDEMENATQMKSENATDDNASE